MLAQPFDPDRIEEFPVAVEPKLDGVRVLANIDTVSNKVRFYSRNGKPFTSFSHLVEPLLCAARSMCLPFVVLDGEVTDGEFSSTVSSVRRKNTAAVNAVYNVFDILSGHGTYTHRRLTAYTFVRQANTFSNKFDFYPEVIAHSVDEVMRIYHSLRRKGFEGAIVKSLDGLYTLGRSHSWMKLKGYDSVDVPVIGAFEGSGKYDGKLGGLVVQYGDVEVRVGIGFADQQREEFWNAHKAAELAGRVVEVGYHEITPAGSLRHPRFIRFRDTFTGSKE